MALIAVALAGCSAVLPRSGPMGRSIAHNASVYVPTVDRKAALDYVLVDLSQEILPYFVRSTTNSLRDGFGGGQGAPAETTLGAGDVVQLTIYEAQSGGLFVPESGGNAAGNYVTLPQQTIDAAGYINVPYAGAVRVAGRQVSAVQAEIEGLLANRAIEPQVIITTTVSRSNRLSILGDVNAPAELDVSPRGERILDVISRAGGLNAPGVETYVTISRNGQNATALFSTIVDNPAENVFVRPNDTIYVSRERRTYLAFGATGATGRFDFEDSDLTLGEALAKAGGLLDSRADPSQVFLYRVVDTKILVEAGIPVVDSQAQRQPVIFRADMNDPAMLFAVQQMGMQDKDIVFVSNASSTELSKFLDLINGVSNTTSNVPANAVNSRNAMDELLN